MIDSFWKMLTEFVVSFAFFTPFILLLWLANVADKRRGEDGASRLPRVLVYGLLVGMWVALLAAGVFAVVMGVAYQRYADVAAMAETYRAKGLDPEVIIPLMQSLPRLGSGIVLIALGGLLILWPATRRLLARRLAIDPESMVHAVALSYSVVIFINLWLVLGMGVDTFLKMVETRSATEEVIPSQLIAFIWGQDIALAVMALVGVGWLSRRSWREALQRLGLVWPAWRDVGVGVGLALGMFFMLIPYGLLLELVGLGIDVEIEKLTEELLGPLTNSLPGVLTLGLAAALGEELVFRGALQPRFGIFVTALLFAFTHSQYVISAATFYVFLLGLILGWVRVRRNTSTAMILHATYNLIIGFLGLLAT
ncbi:MAG TPA: CPBP family intramembrane metalloprotease [Anaerolineae bacterium]|nr:CPBP family intramembrane metalloprotease [Anaerolineae bacterium]